MTALPDFGEVGRDIKTRLESLEGASSQHAQQLSEQSSKVDSLEKSVSSHGASISGFESRLSSGETSIGELKNADAALEEALGAFTLFNTENSI